MRSDETLQLLQRALAERYEILQYIGGGGMANVYLARHRVHGGFNAVKVLSERLTEEPALVEAFLQEARTAAALQEHPNIIQILDVDARDGLYYLVMQYVPGEDLSRYLKRRGALSAAETAYVISETAKALDWAHQRNVVHRDIKPANVRLTPAQRIVVMDFGISKVGRLPTALTSVGLRGGTPHYMSPEQFAGHAAEPRSDLYSLGVMAYECLTGQRPFDGETDQEIWRAQRTQTQAVRQRLPPETPPELSNLIAELMKPSPEERISSAREVVRRLEAIVGDKPPTTFRPESTIELEGYRDQPTVTPLNRVTTASLERPLLVTPAPAEPPKPAAASSRGRLVLVGGCVLLLSSVAAYFALDALNRDASPGTKAVTKLAQPELPLYVDHQAGDMLLVPAGGGGAPPFYIDLHEVSNGAYQRFCQATGRALPAPPNDQPAYLDQADKPAVNLRFEDADAFCAWAGKRLPTEDEWMRAAGGDDGGPYPWGPGPPRIDLANVAGADDGYPSQSPVGAFLAGVSPAGALDMVGNVWEMTATPYSPSDAEKAEWAVVPGAAEAEWRVIKGGAYDRPAGDADLRIETRRGIPAVHRFRTIGFRCAMTAR